MDVWIQSQMGTGSSRSRLCKPYSSSTASGARDAGTSLQELGYSSKRRSTVYLLLTEPAVRCGGRWFWRRRSRAIVSVALDTLQPAADSSPRLRQGWFLHHQHRLGHTGVRVEGQALRPLRRDDLSQVCNQVVEFQVSRTQEQGSRQLVPQ